MIIMDNEEDNPEDPNLIYTVLAEKEFKEKYRFTNEECEAGINYMITVIQIFIVANLPYQDMRFTTMLRILANLIDMTNVDNKKNTH